MRNTIARWKDSSKDATDDKDKDHNVDNSNATEQTCNEEEGNDDADSIMKAKLKLVLWTALLKSVKEITDEN